VAAGPADDLARWMQDEDRVVPASTWASFMIWACQGESNADGHGTGLERWLIAAPGSVRLLDS